MSEVAEKSTIQSLKRRPLRARELDSREFQTEQKRAVPLPGVEEKAELPERVLVVDKEVNDKELQDLAFMEEPVTILINRSTEKNFAPKTTDLVSNNGIWAEMMDHNKRWIRVGYLPRGVAITVKRKTVEMLANAHSESVTTEVLQPVNEDPITNISYAKNFTLPFQVIKDSNPAKGVEWIEKLFARQAMM